MTIEDLRQSMPEYARDTKLNLGKVLTAEGAPGLTPGQIMGVALASAYATKSPAVIAAVAHAAGPVLSDAERQAAKAAAAIMGMNNVYYRFTHLVGDKDYQRLPANLRMNVIGNPGVPKVDFELMSLAVSAINGCGLCIDAHVHELTKAGISKEGISKEGVQSAVRIAAVLAAAAQVMAIEAIAQAPRAQAAE